ncbi:MAG: Hsp20/alpha crystallin family protein [Halobacteriota archaeon]
MSGLKEFGESAANAVLERVGRGVGRMQERKPLPYDLLESDDAYLVVFDTPGAMRSDVQVRFVQDEVQVRVDRFRDFHEGFEMRFPGRGLSLDGSVKLPEDASVDPDNASATLTAHGALQVRIPKDGTVKSVPVSEEDESTTVTTESDESSESISPESGEPVDSSESSAPESSESAESS